MTDEPGPDASGPPAGWAETLARTGRVELGLRRGRGLLVVVGGVAFTAVAIWMSTELLVLGVLLAVFFGLLTLAALWALVAGGPTLVLTSLGIERPRGQPHSLTWAQLRGARVDRQPAAEFLVLEYVGEDGSPAEKIVANKLLDADLDELAAWIGGHAAAPGR